jgi:hypothetical protein
VVFHAAPVADERGAIAAFLRQQQIAFHAVAYGLTDTQAGQRSTHSDLTIGGLIKHVTACQKGWLNEALAAPERVAPPTDADTSTWGGVTRNGHT